MFLGASQRTACGPHAARAVSTTHMHIRPSAMMQRASCRPRPSSHTHTACLRAAGSAAARSLSPPTPGPAQGRRTVVSCQAAAKQLSTAEPGKTTLGFVGMGILGIPMTLNLIKAGYEVVVYNRTQDKCAPVVAAGAKVAASPKDLAQRCTYVFSTLSDPAAALDVANGPTGVAAGMGPGKGYIDVSTVDAETSRAIAAAVHAAGGSFLEAPVSGSKGPAEQGKLVFLTAGDQELFQAVAGPLDAMGKAKFFLGEVGAGAHMKLVVNMVMGSMMAAFAEGMTLAKKSGLKQQDVVDVIGLGAIACPMFALKGPLMEQGKFDPAFPLKHQQKDMRLALELGSQVDEELQVAAAANTLYVAAQEKQLGDLDFSAVIKALMD